MDSSEERRVIGFCGYCTHFELWPLGGGADCHRGHAPLSRAVAEHCPDRHTRATGEGPQFDMSE